MSWLSVLYKAVKKSTGTTDAQFIFSLFAERLAKKDRAALRLKLCSVKWTVDLAHTMTNDARAAEAQEWIDGALTILRD